MEQISPKLKPKNKNLLITKIDINKRNHSVIKKLIDEAYNKAQLILKKHRDILDAVAQVLIIQETISQEEFEEFFK